MAKESTQIGTKKSFFTYILPVLPTVSNCCCVKVEKLSRKEKRGEMNNPQVLGLFCLAATEKFTVLKLVTLKEVAIHILNESDLCLKAKKTLEYCRLWKQGCIRSVSDWYSDKLFPPDEPSRKPPTDLISLHTTKPGSICTSSEEATLCTDQAAELKKLKILVKKNTVECTIHALANAESFAIDLFWDLIARFSPPSIITRTELRNGPMSYSAATQQERSDILLTTPLTVPTSDACYIYLPNEFYMEMVHICQQEAEHFMSWYHRLNELGFPFGTFPNSKGLWQSAGDTAGINACISTVF
jgi:hypothetical protein